MGSVLHSDWWISVRILRMCSRVRSRVHSPVQETQGKVSLFIKSVAVIFVCFRPASNFKNLRLLQTIKHGVIEEMQPSIIGMIIFISIIIIINNIIVPTFDTKVTEYLCSGWVSKDFVVLSLNLKRYFTCDLFSYSYGGLKIAILTINATIND